MMVRYKDSVDPIETDARDIDSEVALLIGEAASQESSGASDQHIRGMAQTWQELPEPQPDPTYYDRPLLNASVWGWAIPTYYYVGGLAGGALALAAAAQLRRSKRLRRLIRRCHWIGFIGAAISGGLLIYDLGLPSRFFNMLRVFRPTSPMNMGAWILSGAGGTSMLTLLLRERSGVTGAIGEAAGFMAGVFGMGLATYTGVLVSNTAVPIWQQSRRVLPILFGASAMSSVGSAFELFVEDPEERRMTKLFGTVGQAAELAASVAMERQASVVPRVAIPLKRGLSGFLWRSSALFTAASVTVSFLPNAFTRQTYRRRVCSARPDLCSCESQSNMRAQSPRAMRARHSINSGTFRFSHQQRNILFQS